MKKQKVSFVPPEKAKVMKPKKFVPPIIRIQRISYIGNINTNRHANNVRIYVQPFFDKSDELVVIDVRNRIRHENIGVTDIKCGKYMYQRISSSIFGKHTGKLCMLVPIEIRRSGILDPESKVNKYVIYSKNNTAKLPLLLIIIDNEFYESVLKI